MRGMIVLYTDIIKKADADIGAALKGLFANIDEIGEKTILDLSFGMVEKYKIEPTSYLYRMGDRSFARVGQKIYTYNGKDYKKYNFEEAYQKWKGVMNRSKYEYYKEYRKLGISVSEELKKSENFIIWMFLISNYTDVLYTDRINPFDDYIPENMKFSTNIESANNKTNNIYLTIFCVTDTLAVWCRRAKVDYDTMYGFIYTFGLFGMWFVEDVIRAILKDK